MTIVCQMKKKNEEREKKDKEEVNTFCNLKKGTVKINVATCGESLYTDKLHKFQKPRTLEVDTTIYINIVKIMSIDNNMNNKICKGNYCTVFKQ